MRTAEAFPSDMQKALTEPLSNAVLDEMATWRNLPLEAGYPAVFFDVLRVKIRDECVVRNKAVPTALGVCAPSTALNQDFTSKEIRECRQCRRTARALFVLEKFPSENSPSRSS